MRKHKGRLPAARQFDALPVAALWFEDLL